MENITKQYTVKGMMCAHCEARVKKAVETINGVVSCSPSAAANAMTVVCSEPIDDAEIKSVVDKEGYELII